MGLLTAKQGNYLRHPHGEKGLPRKDLELVKNPKLKLNLSLNLNHEHTLHISFNLQLYRTANYALVCIKDRVVSSPGIPFFKKRESGSLFLLRFLQLI